MPPKCGLHLGAFFISAMPHRPMTAPSTFIKPSDETELQSLQQGQGGPCSPLGTRTSRSSAGNRGRCLQLEPRTGGPQWGQGLRTHQSSEGSDPHQDAGNGGPHREPGCDGSHRRSIAVTPTVVPGGVVSFGSQGRRSPSGTWRRWSPSGPRSGVLHRGPMDGGPRWEPGLQRSPLGTRVAAVPVGTPGCGGLRRGTKLRRSPSRTRGYSSRRGPKGGSPQWGTEARTPCQGVTSGIISSQAGHLTLPLSTAPSLISSLQTACLSSLPLKSTPLNHLQPGQAFLKNKNIFVLLSSYHRCPYLLTLLSSR